MNIEIQLAGEALRIFLRNPETKRFFRRALVKENVPDWDIRVEDSDYDLYAESFGEEQFSPYAEHYMLMARASGWLLKRNKVLIHGVSFLWQGRAWLITGPSGVGKTTQLRLWQRLWPEDITVINGDKSVLEQNEDGGFYLYPSPWTGKEGDRGEQGGPLAGIVLLRQDNSDVISRLPPCESVATLYTQFLVTGEDPGEVRQLARLEDGLLRSVPIWLLRNRGGEKSARLTRETWEAYGREKDKTI